MLAGLFASLLEEHGIQDQGCSELKKKKNRSAGEGYRFVIVQLISVLTTMSLIVFTTM